MASFAPAKGVYNIIKADDPNFSPEPAAMGNEGVRQFYDASPLDIPPMGMPSGPGGGYGAQLGGKRKRTKKVTRTYPRGIRKILPTRNPSQTRSRTRKASFPSKKALGAARQTAKNKAASKSLRDIKASLEGRGLIKPTSKAPPATLKKLYEEALGAGLIN
jgi:hypothetical protein